MSAVPSPSRAQTRPKPTRLSALPDPPHVATTPAHSLVIVAKPLPVRRVAVGDGDETQWDTSPGGLVGALLPVAGATEGAWVGWSGAPDDCPEPFEHGGAHLFPVGIGAEELPRYYDGFSNGTLWPLYHDAVRAPSFHRSWWDAYVAVNRRFADTAARVAAPGATVWVHDYQLSLVPGYLRKRRPDLRIGFFLHIPYPPQELFMQIPWRRELLAGMLGADVVGFQVPVAAANFATLARRLLGAKGSSRMLRYGDRLVRVGAFPISIDVTEVEKAAASPGVERRAAALRTELGNPRTVLLGVDRLDYTKGIDVRLRAIHELLQDGRLSTPDAVFLQIAVPSREQVDDYVGLREHVERKVGEINGEFGRMGHPAVHYLHQNQGFQQLIDLYRAADVMLVTPLRDGMNLVAKEYVAARVDGTGALVLSEFAGAARELRGAFLVNPHDITAVKDAIVAATAAPDRAARMKALRKAVRRHDVHAWAREFLAALGD